MTATASLTTAAAAPPRTARTDSTALVVLCAVQLLLVVDVSVVNIGLGALRRDLGVSTEATPWVVAAYSLTYGGLLLLGGRAGDLMGRRRALQLGVLVFGLASLLAGLAPSTA
ncbi:MAG TPA: MFS transporter, partial [Pedococcus sp.]|nr:MFS transporter [Pedococcus sp.]